MPAPDVMLDRAKAEGVVTPSIFNDCPISQVTSWDVKCTFYVKTL